MASNARTQLGDDNYDVTEAECPDCSDGVLCVNDFELVCDDCHTVRRKDNSRSVGPYDPLADFQDNRESFRYPNSGEIRMQGGFFDPVEDIEPTDNGIYGMGHDDTSLNNTNRRH